MAVLDDLSGFEFEDVIEDVFRNLGYENVRQADRTADEGRDVLMEEVVDGTRRAIIVECKHTGTVGRPVVQKLHSAIATFDFDGPKTRDGRHDRPVYEPCSGVRKPPPAKRRPTRNRTARWRGPPGDRRRDRPRPLQRPHRDSLRRDATSPYDPAADVDAAVEVAFRDIENIESADLPEPHSAVTFRPVVAVTADTNERRLRDVGGCHPPDQRPDAVRRPRRTRAAAGRRRRRRDAGHREPPCDGRSDAEQFGAVFDDVEENRFGQTQTEYKEWAVERLQQHHTTTVTYTGDNNVTYNKTCEPNRSDISVQTIEPVYLPEVRHTTDLQEYTYPYEYYAAGPSRVTAEDGIHRCVHCDERRRRRAVHVLSELRGNLLRQS